MNALGCRQNPRVTVRFRVWPAMLGGSRWLVKKLRGCALTRRKAQACERGKPRPTPLSGPSVLNWPAIYPRSGDVLRLSGHFLRLSIPLMWQVQRRRHKRVSNAWLHASPASPERSRHGPTSIWIPVRQTRGEGELARNVGSGCTLSVLCSRRRIPPHAATIQDRLYLPGLRPSHKPRSLLQPMRVPEVPADGPDRATLPG